MTFISVNMFANEDNVLQYLGSQMTNWQTIEIN